MTTDEMKTEIAQVLKFLRVPLNDNPMEVQRAGAEAESWYGRLTAIESIAISELEKARHAKLTAKTAKETELEREIILDWFTTEETKFKNLTHGVVKALELRVNFCQSLLKAYSLEGRRTQTMP